MNAYYSAYLNRANFLMNYSQFDEAERNINRALEIKPGSPEAIQLQNKNKQLKSLSNNIVK
jgi:predicted RNA polymerase sigma factor